jgi:hypothetical protein
MILDVLSSPKQFQNIKNYFSFVSSLLFVQLRCQAKFVHAKVARQRRSVQGRVALIMASTDGRVQFFYQLANCFTDRFHCSFQPELISPWPSVMPSMELKLSQVVATRKMLTNL